MNPDIFDPYLQLLSQPLPNEPSIVTGRARGYQSPQPERNLGSASPPGATHNQPILGRNPFIFPNFFNNTAFPIDSIPPRGDQSPQPENKLRSAAPATATPGDTNVGQTSSSFPNLLNFNNTTVSIEALLQCTSTLNNQPLQLNFNSTPLSTLLDINRDQNTATPSTALNSHSPFGNFNFPMNFQTERPPSNLQKEAMQSTTPPIGQQNLQGIFPMFPAISNPFLTTNNDMVTPSMNPQHQSPTTPALSNFQSSSESTEFKASPLLFLDELRCKEINNLKGMIINLSQEMEEKKQQLKKVNKSLIDATNILEGHRADRKIAADRRIRELLQELNSRHSFNRDMTAQIQQKETQIDALLNQNRELVKQMRKLHRDMEASKVETTNQIQMLLEQIKEKNKNAAQQMPNGDDQGVDFEIKYKRLKEQAEGRLQQLENENYQLRVELEACQTNQPPQPGTVNQRVQRFWGGAAGNG